MDTAYLSTIAALAGTVLGALGSMATTWLAATVQERGRRAAQAIARRENLYGEFIEECSKVFSDALVHKLDNISKLVHLYALVSKLRLFAPPKVIATADEVMRRILQTYEGPERDFHALVKEIDMQELDILLMFSESCRRDLDDM
jgi:hypothetical protein